MESAGVNTPISLMWEAQPQEGGLKVSLSKRNRWEMKNLPAPFASLEEISGESGVLVMGLIGYIVKRSCQFCLWVGLTEDFCFQVRESKAWST